MLVAAFLLRERLPGFVIPAAYTFAIYDWAKRFQRRLFSAHIEAGGRQHSSWRAAGIGIAWLLVTIFLIGVVVVARVLLGFE